RWFIEGDIKGSFDNIDHTVLLSILREKIHDNRFLTLIENLLKAGYLEQWNYRPTLSGTPQGGIISPLLPNIYLDRLDQFVEQTLHPEHPKRQKTRKSREYENQLVRSQRLAAKGATATEVKPLRQAMRWKKTNDDVEPNYRRLRYIRYADDFLLGFIGPRAEG